MSAHATFQNDKIRANTTWKNEPMQGKKKPQEKHNTIPVKIDLSRRVVVSARIGTVVVMSRNFGSDCYHNVWSSKYNEERSRLFMLSFLKHNKKWILCVYTTGSITV